MCDVCNDKARKSLEALMADTLKNLGVIYPKTMYGADLTTCFNRTILDLRDKLKREKAIKKILRSELHKMHETAAVIRIAQNIQIRENRNEIYI